MQNHKVIVAHPGKQHSFRLAESLKKKDMLHKYMTTVYYKNSNSMTKILTNFLDNNNKSRALKRRSPYLNDSDVLVFNEFVALFLLALQRIDVYGKVVNRVREAISNSFQKKVAYYAIRHNVDAVIMFDTNAKICFEILKIKAPHILRILDNASPARNFLYSKYQDKRKSIDPFIETLYKYKYLLNRKIANWYKYEIALSDYHIVASSFSRKSLEYNGVRSELISVVPYGVDVDKFKPQIKHDTREIIRVLFVGEVNQRKGIYQLLECAKRKASSNIKFDLVGDGFLINERLYHPYCKYATFHGRISGANLIEFYQGASIFVLPTMGEGFGLVILEALACGLPVICTENCGGKDIISNGYDGFVIPYGDTEALIEKITWFEKNTSKLEEMSSNARKTALGYSWKKYEEEIVKSVERMIQSLQK